MAVQNRQSEGKAGMKTILCYGDSNTHGAMPMAAAGDMRRFGKEDRWPGILLRELEPDLEVIEEGLPGRTTVHSDPIEGAHKNGLAHLAGQPGVARTDRSRRADDRQQRSQAAFLRAGGRHRYFGRRSGGGDSIGEASRCGRDGATGSSGRAAADRRGGLPGAHACRRIGKVPPAGPDFIRRSRPSLAPGSSMPVRSFASAPSMASTSSGSSIICSAPPSRRRYERCFQSRPHEASPARGSSAWAALRPWEGGRPRPPFR